MAISTLIRDERLPANVVLRYESRTVADVICRRCQTEIGRLQTVPVEPDADMEEIYSEIQLIADEHQPACAGRPPAE
jgi:hypothetical protein